MDLLYNVLVFLFVAFSFYLALFFIFYDVITGLFTGTNPSSEDETHSSSKKKIKKKKSKKCDNNNNSNDKTWECEEEECQKEIVQRILELEKRKIQTPYIVGICGSSGSGKSFIARMIIEYIKTKYGASDSDIIVISQDSYYKGGNSETNYDIPSAVDFELLVKHLKQLISGHEINCPMYDFKTHSRMSETKVLRPAKIIIVEGILIFTHDDLLRLLQKKIFVHVAGATHIFRRTKRDILQRGRDLEEISERYERHVWPSFRRYVEPSAEYADLTVNNIKGNYVGLSVLLQHIGTIYQMINNN